MARSAAKDPLRSMWADAATALDAAIPGLAPAALTRALVLAVVRRAVLARTPVAAPAELDRRREALQALGCPLLAAELDEPGVPADSALGLVELPQPTPEPGWLLERLRGFELERRGRAGKLRVGLRARNRRRRGQFFTPDWMVARLVALALPAETAAAPPARILDPACGDGRLLSACLDRLLDAAGQEGPQRTARARQLVGGGLYGVDRDPLCVALARTALWQRCDPTAGPVAGLERAVVCGDALVGRRRGAAGAGAIRWEREFPDACGDDGAGFDALVANPPFDVLTGFARRPGLRAYTERLRQAGYRLALSGTLNLYRLFLERALQLLAPGGRLAIVLPYGFLMDRSAAGLRRHLLENGWLERVETFPESARVFEQVGQSVLLAAVEHRTRADRALTMVDGTGQRPSHRVSLAQVELLDGETLALPVVPPEALALAGRLRERNGSTVGELALGRVGELDQTQFRDCIRSQPDAALLVRGAHVGPYRVRLGTEPADERWADLGRFVERRAHGPWRREREQPRIVQTGIVNLEASRRLVAAEVPPGVVLGNSVNYWVPRDDLASSGLEPEAARGYLLGLLNSTPLEWRFRLTSSNNNINLYEVHSLPLPRLTNGLAAGRLDGYLAQTMRSVLAGGLHPLGLVRQITTAWGGPERDDRAVALLIGRLARTIAARRAGEADAAPPAAWLEHVLDHLVNWHLGLDEPDLERMLADVPARAWKG